jgi:adenine deaminase
MNIIDIIPIAKGDRPADVLLKNCRIVNVFTGEIEESNIALFKKRIAGVGDYTDGIREIDVRGNFVVPGLIDAHMHIESSMLSPMEFIKTVLRRGTTTLIADPHEIANVFGLKGIKYMLDSTEGLPINLYFMIPSAVPATNMETSGAKISVMDMIGFVEKFRRVSGLGEVMNYPDILNLDEDSIAKIELIRHKYKPIDGHSPGLSGKDLNAYIDAFVRSDHECNEYEEAYEKISRGMQLLIREGSTERNMIDLLPVLNEKTFPYVSFCTDDKHPGDILKEGHIDFMINKAIKNGIDPITAIRCSTINTANHYHLRSMGAIAPGYKADILVVEDLENFYPKIVIKDSEIVAENGELVKEFDRRYLPLEEINSFKCPYFEKEDFKVIAKGKKINVIKVLPDIVMTKRRIMNAKIENNEVVQDINNDILKISVICRYTGEKSYSLGFVNGASLKEGAVATSVGHDSHNMAVLGANDEDMVLAANRCITLGGGLIVANKGKIVEELSLPIAGLMSDLTGEEVAEKINDLKNILHKMGCKIPDLFMTLSFIQLSVIPDFRITNLGLVDSENHEFCSLFYKGD